VVFKISTVDIIVFQGGDDGRGYRNICKIAGGPEPILSRWYFIWYTAGFLIPVQVTTPVVPTGAL
jgi:hypothetical protein